MLLGTSLVSYAGEVGKLYCLLQVLMHFHVYVMNFRRFPHPRVYFSLLVPYPCSKYSVLLGKVYMALKVCE